MRLLFLCPFLYHFYRHRLSICSLAVNDQNKKKILVHRHFTKFWDKPRSYMRPYAIQPNPEAGSSLSLECAKQAREAAYVQART